MSLDPHFIRFIGTLSLFTFFMAFLISSDNLLLLFFGWEGVGVCSYLLINFWYTRILANKAAMKAIFVNKLGDLSLILGILLILTTVFTTAKYHYRFNESRKMLNLENTYICLNIF